MKLYLRFTTLVNNNYLSQSNFRTNEIKFIKSYKSLNI